MKKSKKIGGLAALILAGATAFGFSGNRESSEFDRFPDRLPGAEKIEKYEVPGAKYCLVHIKQDHGNPDLSSGTMVPDKNTFEVQKNIRKIINGIGKKADNAYFEGCSVEKAKSMNKKIESMQKTGKTPDLDSFQDSLKGAVESNLELRGAEDNALNKRLFKRLREMEMFSSSENSEKYKESARDYKVTNELRENYVLERIASDEESLALVVYGAAHNFGGKETCGEDYKMGIIGFKKFDTIHEWNKRNPDKKFSLIEITPEGYDSKTMSRIMKK